jgi:hypothetical protein
VLRPAEQRYRLDAVVGDSCRIRFAPGGGYGPGTTLPGSSEWTFANT